MKKLMTSKDTSVRQKIHMARRAGLRPRQPRNSLWWNRKAKSSQTQMAVMHRVKRAAK